MAHYLVTGGAGFIGSHLAEELAQRGHRVRVADSLVTGKRSNLDHIKGVEFLEGDLSDLAFARRAAAGCDYVLHQAALPSVPRSVADPLTSNKANVDATLNMLIAARDAHVRRLVFAGSSSAYGDTPTLPKHEAMPTTPQSPYALQKIIGEQYLQLFTRLYGLETVTIRYFNVFGPRQDPSSPYSGVIAVFANALLKDRSPMIYGDGEQTRDFTYVANVVDGVLKACDAPDVSSLIINVATGGRSSGRLRRCYPSPSCVIPYCSSFLYKLLRGVPMISAVFEMFQLFSRSLPTRNARSADSLNSRSVLRFFSLSDACGLGSSRTTSRRSSTSIVSPGVMMMSRSTVFFSSRTFPFHRARWRNSIAGGVKR